MFIKPTNVFEIKKIISELHGSKSPGHDSLPAKIVQAVSEYICEPLCYMFNLSFVSGCFPDRLKLAKVIPLYKSENKNLLLIIDPYQYYRYFPKFWKSLWISDFMNSLIATCCLLKINMGLDPNIPLTWHY